MIHSHLTALVGPSLLALVLLACGGQPQTPQSAQHVSSGVAASSAVSATASIEGIVVRRGTHDPVSGADVELSRVEGTPTAPMPRDVSEAFAQALVEGGPSGPQPPAELAPEVKYAKTGDDGKFLFRDLKEGKYRLVAVRIDGAYFPAEFGQHDPRGRGLNFPIAEGQAMKDAQLEMAPTVAITGRVLDSDGEPMGHVTVMALELQYQQGRRILNIMQETYTDERGNYRLFWLAPGRYYVAARVTDTQKREIVSAVLPPGRSGSFNRADTPVVTRRIKETGEVVEETYALVYNGGALSPDRAQPVDVQDGATFGGVDIPMGAGLMVSHHIRGVVVGPDGQPAAGAPVLALSRQTSPSMSMLRATANGKGIFDVGGVSPGSYSIFAAANPPNLESPDEAAPGGMGWGYVELEVANADVGNLQIAATSGINLTVRISIEASAPGVDSDLRNIRINLRLTRDPDITGVLSRSAPLPPASSLPSLPPGTANLLVARGDYRVAVSGVPANGYVKSIRMGGADILNGGLHIGGAAENPLEVVIGTDAGEISGVVLDLKRNPMPNAVVALIPDSPALRQRPDLFRSATTDESGKFRLQTIPPGSYTLFAWEYAAPDSWQDPEFIQAYELYGTSIDVRERSRQEMPPFAVIPRIPSVQ